MTAAKGSGTGRTPAKKATAAPAKKAAARKTPAKKAVAAPAKKTTTSRSRSTSTRTRRGTTVKTPASLKLIEGRGNGRDSGGREIAPPPPFVRLPPEPPEFLTGDALEEWDRIVPELQRLGLTKVIDAAALTAYCLCVQRLYLAQRMVQEEGEHSGLLKTNSQGLVRHPAIAIIEAASKELRAWAHEFGLTPAAEANLTMPEAGSGDDNPFASGASG